MYSIVMLMAMSGAPEMPAFGGRGCGGGCGGYSCGGGYACGGGCGGRLGGGLFGGRMRGCGGCYGGCGGYSGGYGCGGYESHGCYGGHAVSSGCGCCGHMASTGYSHGGMMMVAAPASASATVIVNLPADAKLYFDGTATTSTSASRRFTTPALPSGSDASYTVIAEVVRDGKTLKTTKVVNVRAGQTTEVSLTDAQFTTTAVVKN